MVVRAMVACLDGTGLSTTSEVMGTYTAILVSEPSVLREVPLKIVTTFRASLSGTSVPRIERAISPSSFLAEQIGRAHV